jgi:hypothetical protein
MRGKEASVERLSSQPSSKGAAYIGYELDFAHFPIDQAWFQKKGFEAT